MLTAQELLNMKIDLRITYILMTKSRAHCVQCSCVRAEIPPEILWTPGNEAEMIARTHDADAAIAAAKCAKTSLRMKYEALKLIIDKHRRYMPVIIDEVHAIEKANGQELMTLIMQHIEKLNIVYTSL
jgi:hypothetical protein